MSETIEALENMGHETVLFEIPNMDRASALFFKNIMPDRGAFCNYLFSNEPLSPFIRLFALMLKVEKIPPYCKLRPSANIHFDSGSCLHSLVCGLDSQNDKSTDVHGLLIVCKGSFRPP